MTKNKIILTWEEFYSVFSEYVKRENPSTEMFLIFGQKPNGSMLFEQIIIYGIHEMEGLVRDINTLNDRPLGNKYYPTKNNVPFECLSGMEMFFFSAEFEDYLLEENEVNSLVIKKTNNGIVVEIEPCFENLSIRNHFLKVLLEMLY